MPVLKLSYDVYHLGVYLAAALMWLFLCLLLAFNSRLILRDRSGGDYRVRAPAPWHRSLSE